MAYFIAFLEGIITFISPCLLPMLPIYLAWFAGSEAKRSSGRAPWIKASGFVLGFTLVFVTMGVFASAIGGFLRNQAFWVNLISGSIVILFGLHYIGLLRLGFLDRTVRLDREIQGSGFWSAVLFGLVFSIGWTPCVGVFLGSALLLASQQSSILQGVTMLLLYSLGLGIPFIISALLMDRLKESINWIKRHYQLITKISGAFLILVGILMMTGRLGALLAQLSVT